MSVHKTILIGLLLPSLLAPAAAVATPTMDEASALIQDSKWPEAIKALDEITTAEPDNGMAWFQLGYALHGSGDLARAITIDEKAATFPDYRGPAFYNLACAHALQGDKDKAFAALFKAQASGKRNLSQIRADPDLASLHDDKRFAQLRGYEFRSLEMKDGTELRYGLYLPNPFDAKESYPVLLAFPPGSQSAGAVETGMEMFWGEQAASRGWVIISPVKPDGGWYKKAAKSYAGQLLNHIRKQYQLEGGKLHIVGCSGGGPSAFHVGIDWHKRIHTLTGIPGYPRKSRDFSRLARLKGVRVNLYAGGNDRGWPRSLERTHKRLQELDVDSHLKIFPGENHVMESMLNGGLMKRLDKMRIR